MAAAAQDDDDIFVYMGGDQQVPYGVRRARIHKSIKIVPRRAFHNRHHLMYVEIHDGVEIIEEMAFYGCFSLRSIKLLGVKIVKGHAFYNCRGLTDVEFGNKLETIELEAFDHCAALGSIRIQSVRTIGSGAFASCDELSDVEFGEVLRTLQSFAFSACCKLKRVALPLKDNMIGDRVFDGCVKLTTVDLVGGIHRTIASLHLESWRNEMKNEMNRINQTLPTITISREITNPRERTSAIQQWMRAVIHHLNQYKEEHRKLLKEATTLLELALWKTSLDDDGGNRLDREGVRITRESQKKARKETYVTSGAHVVIKNVLPFLQLLE